MKSTCPLNFHSPERTVRTGAERIRIYANPLSCAADTSFHSEQAYPEQAAGPDVMRTASLRKNEISQRDKP